MIEDFKKVIVILSLLATLYVSVIGYFGMWIPMYAFLGFAVLFLFVSYMSGVNYKFIFYLFVAFLCFDFAFLIWSLFR
jgi:hypothetical protein